MANPHRGQVDLKAGDKVYTLSFSINAMCELEEQIGEPFPKIAAGLNDAAGVKFSTVRALVWASLRDHHDDVSLEAAGDLVEVAGLPSVMTAIGKAFANAFPAGAAKANPRKAAKAS